VDGGMRLKNISIRRKLTVIDLLTTALALAVACVAFILYEGISFRNTVLGQLSINAEIIGSNSTAALAFDDQRTAEEILSALRAERHIVSSCIYKRDGRIFATYLREGVKPEFPKNVPDDMHRFERDHLILTRPIVLDEERIGLVYLKYDLKEMRARIFRYAGIAVSVFLVSSLLSFGVASRLQQTIAKPLQNLSGVAKTVSQKKDYTLRAVKTSEDEVGQLIDGFNEMLGQIQERDHALIQDQEELEKRVLERTKELKAEIAERKKAEFQIRKSLKEKEVLLKEIHHRVKNNLQVISSLLYLQSKKILHLPALDMFLESQNRIRSMALIHEKLYQSEDFYNIDFSEYIRNLIGHLSNTYGAKLKNVDVRVTVENVMLSIDKGIPCGLIINELVTNALKYAFPDGRKGGIAIDIQTDPDRQVTLSVTDDGIGLPSQLNLEKSETLGLQLVKSLAQQLKGEIRIERTQGTAFRITFEG
jgi:two-component sensor histidine kinase/HAMP domain-containing protein